MRQIIADIPKDTAAEDRRRSLPRVAEQGMGELPERGGQDDKQGRWHDEAVFIHREVVVDAVEEEVEGDADAVVREVVVNVEEAAVEAVLDEGPEAEAEKPVEGCRERGEVLRGEVGAVGDGGQPHGRDHPPGCQGEGLEEVAEERGGGAAAVVARAVDLLEVEFFAEVAAPDLHKEGLVEVEELVRLEVRGGVGFLVQVFGGGHAGGCVDGLLAGL